MLRSVAVASSPSAQLDSPPPPAAPTPGIPSVGNGDFQDEDTEPDGVADQRPTDAAIKITATDGSRLTLTDLPIYKDWRHPLEGASSYNTYPDTQVSTATIADRTTTVTIENAHIQRDLTLTIKRRSSDKLAGSHG